MPATAGCARRWSPSRRTRRRRCARRSRGTDSTCSATPSGPPWNSRNSVGASGSASSEWTLTAAIAAGSSSSQRATGMPSWTASVTVATSPSSASNTQRAAAICSGIPWMRSVSSVITRERALRPEQQAREVVARRGLARPRARAQDGAVGQHRLEAEDVLAHRAVAAGQRARRRGGGHAAERRVGARVDGEEQPVGAEPALERQAGDPGLHAAVEVLGADVEHAVHAASGRASGRRRPGGHGPRASCPRPTG